MIATTNEDFKGWLLLAETFDTETFKPIKGDFFDEGNQ